MIFQLKADCTFEAENILDAMNVLGKHFIALRDGRESDLLEGGECLVCPCEGGAIASPQKTEGEGWKDDHGKQPWYPMPLVLLRPLADVFRAGEKKYATFNCLNPFKDADRRFWDSTMRHLELCQLDPLAIDPETGCYHAAEACFGMLLRIFNAKRVLEEQQKCQQDVAGGGQDRRSTPEMDLASESIASPQKSSGDKKQKKGA